MALDGSHRPDRRGRGIAGRVIGAVVGPLVNPVVEQVDVDDVVSRVDVDRLVDRVDIDQVLQRVDVNELLGRIDVNELLERIDLDTLLERVDLDRVLAGVDVNALVERIDTDALIERTELGSLIAQASSSTFTRVLDVGRSQIVTADQIVHGLVHRGRRRRAPSEDSPPDSSAVTTASAPTGNVRPVAPASDDAGDVAPPHKSAGAIASSSRLTSPAPGSADRASVTGQGTSRATAVDTRRDIELQDHPAGMVSRFFAFVVDVFVASLLFAVVQWLFSIAYQVVAGDSWNVGDNRAVTGIAYVLFAFAYLTVPVAIHGRTPGMGLFGLKIVKPDGAPVNGRRAALRAAALPLSFLLFGAGFLIGLFRFDRRALQDLIAGTSVVYAWDARGARWRLGSAAAQQPESTASAPPP